MSTIGDKELLLRSHESSRGLDDAAVKEIADAAQLVQLDEGDCLHRANQPLTSVYLIVHGRLKQSVVDIHGALLVQRFLKRGSQFGVLAAAHAEPVPVEVVAVEPSAVLELDFETAIRFTRTHELFGLNLTRSISSMVREVLLSERKPKHALIVTIFHQSAATRVLTQRLIQRLVELGESICLMSDRVDEKPIECIPFMPLVTDGKPMAREALRRQINAWSEHGRIMLDVDASLDPANISMLIEFSDQVIWCCDEDHANSCRDRLKATGVSSRGSRDKVSVAWLVPSESWVGPASTEPSELTQRDFKISFSRLQQNQSRGLCDGLERLVHQLRGVRIGLALGGGGARGMAHLGVLKALEQSGLVVDVIAGTSAGAMTGILHAAGFDPAYLADRFAEDLTPAWPFRMMPGGKHWYLVYKYRRGHFNRMLRRYLSEWHLEQLPIPAHAVAVDLVTGRPVIRNRGDAVDAILESINLPVFSKPICRNGQALVDGGVVDNIPADVLVRCGCNFVIAVSVTSALETEFVKNRPDTPTAEMNSASTLQTVLRSYLVQHVNLNSVGVQPADFIIEPSVAGVELSDFSQTRDLAALGERSALDGMARLKSLLSKLDDKLFVGTT